MISFVIWYVLISLLGLLTFPLAHRLFPALADRGYALSRTLGLLLWAYAFWLLTSLGVLQNTLGGILFALALIVGLSIWSVMRGGSPQNWLRENIRTVLTVEALFLVAFAFMALVRAANPELTATEKPMELAFMNAIARSPSFPPNDPWLSGYAISYYYFGYVMAAMLSTVTSTVMGITFNLMIALVFALGALGAFSIVFNLLEAYERRTGQNLAAAILGPIFVLLVSNAGGFLEMLHTRWLFWRQNADGTLTSTFWTWLDMRELSQPPTGEPGWMPTRFLWWWRSSRVVMDRNFVGNPVEVIDEFPFFSFLLADLHPHVLAIPFVFLATALALNLYLSGGGGVFSVFGRKIRMSGMLFAGAALVLGGLAFLNTWDFPIHVAVFVGAYVLTQVMRDGWSWARLTEFIGLGLVLGVAGVALYFPFYVGFSSQAGGILPNLIYPTRGIHLWVMFGTLMVPLFAWLATQWPGRSGREHVLLAAKIVSAFVLILWAFSLVLGWGISLLPALGNYPDLGNLFVGSQGAPDATSLLREAFVRRVTTPTGWLTLAILLYLALTVVLKNTVWEREEDSETSLAPPIILFPLLLTLVGGLLVLGPEFLFLRDQFGTRMNTVFKFYYQAWLLWAVTSAFGAAILFQHLRGGRRAVWSVAFVVVLVVGLTYPVLSLNTKTNGFDPPNGLTLDGVRSHRAYLIDDDFAAVDWLTAQPLGTVLESVGGSYSTYARISAHTGYPTVLGWPGHESQWRGGATEMGSREGDIRTIYQSNSWDETRSLLEKYEVRYVYIGPKERNTYRVNDTKFDRFLEIAYQFGQVKIYRVP